MHRNLKPDNVFADQQVRHDVEGLGRAVINHEIRNTIPRPQPPPKKDVLIFSYLLVAQGSLGKRPEST